MEAAGAVLDLRSPGPDQTERSLTVELKSVRQPGTELPVKAYLNGRSAPLTFPNALEVIGPLPVIVSSKLSLPTGMAIAISPDEFPAGYTLDALAGCQEHRANRACCGLGCADGVGGARPCTIGEQGSGWSLQQLSPDQLFLAFETSGLPAGCVLQAVIDNRPKGSSKPFMLAHILRVPQIDSFPLADAPPQNGARAISAHGQNLEMIQKLGWDELGGQEVSGLPAPMRGPGLKQSIQMQLPDPPSPDAVVYVWLRGDKQARKTTIKAPALPPAPPPPVPVSPDTILSNPPDATPDPASQHQ